MIVVVPVSLLVPAMFVFVPPFVAVFPAPFPGLPQFMAPVVRLLAGIAMLVNRAIQFVIRVNQFSLAVVVRIRARRTR